MQTPTRLFDFIFYQEKHHPLPDAIATKVNGQWEKHSTAEIINLSRTLAEALIEKGIQPGDKVAIISATNRFEWNICDLATLMVGGVDVPMYPTASEEDWTFILNDSEAKMCFVSDQELYEKALRVQPNCPALKDIFVFNAVAGAPNWKEMLALGEQVNQLPEVHRRMEAVKKDDLATLIYTSGTTGRPKGVMLSHWNIASNAIDSEDRLPAAKGTRSLSFLPLCHVYERMLVYLYTYNSVSIYYAESMDTIGDNLREVKPAIFSAVPRLLEKVYDRIMGKGAELTGVKKALFFWAVGLAGKYDVKGRSMLYDLQLGLARKLIFSKWQEALGGQVQAVASGAAALNPSLARVFLAAGINIQEGYGLTETSPVISVNCPKNDGTRIGTVGRVINNVQVKIAEDGEILVKGPNVMQGYYKNPEATAEVMDAEGWFHTGDIGQFVEGQYLKITDRKKEIFKTGGGKYIAPQAMENAYKESRFIEQIMVIGEAEKHPAALVQPAFDVLREWAKRHGYSLGSNAEIAADARVRERIGKAIELINQRYGQWEQVKKFELTPDVWSVAGGEMTPTLKLRRKPILAKYADLYEKIYGHPKA
jgi:long-chain acyl-CoA synthetase